jgi:peroxiredoxin
MKTVSTWHIGAFLGGIGLGLGLIVFLLGGDIYPGARSDRAAYGGTQARTSPQDRSQEQAEEDSSAPPEAPDFTLERLSGETFRLSDQRGTVVVINFWATWCLPCRKEIPDFIELQQSMKGDVLFVGVSLDKRGKEKVRAFADGLDVNYPIVIDDGAATEKYGPIPVIPTSFVVGRDGRVRLQSVGLLTKKKLRPVLRKLAGGGRLGAVEPPFRRVDGPLGKN